MKRMLFLLLVIGLTASMTAMASMSTSKIRKETRFLTDKMAYELDLSTPQYNDIYEINYDFINSVGNIMDYVTRGEEWAMNDYYEALDIRNDDLKWVLNEGQYRRFMGADYFYRPVYVTGNRWSFRIYINYPNRSLFYFGVPYHYRSYCGAHYRPHIHHISYYRGRYPNVGHYPVPHGVRDQRVFNSYRRSDFGSVRFRPNSTTRPHNAPTRPSVSGRPGSVTRPSGSTRPSSPNRPSGVDRPTNSNRPDHSTRPGSSARPEGTTRPSSRPGSSSRPNHSNRPDNTSRPESSNRPEGSIRPEGSGRPGNSTGSGSSTSRPRPESNQRPSRGERSDKVTPSRTERGNVSSRSSERRSSSESTRASRSSSNSSERGNGSSRR